MDAVRSEQPLNAPHDLLAPVGAEGAADPSLFLTIDELEPRLTPDDFVLPPGLVNRQVGWGC